MGEIKAHVRVPSMVQIAESVGGTMLLMEFSDATGARWTASAIAGPAVNSSAEEIRLHETRGKGLRLVSFKVVESR